MPKMLIVITLGWYRITSDFSHSSKFFSVEHLLLLQSQKNTHIVFVNTMAQE